MKISVLWSRIKRKIKNYRKEEKEKKKEKKERGQTCRTQNSIRTIGFYDYDICIV